MADEFTRHDEDLSELKEYYATKPVPAAHGQCSDQHRDGRDGRRAAQPTIPANVTSLLPKQDGKELCMRYLSKDGCRGQGDGRCYRAHFRPHILHPDVRSYIIERFHGLASSFSDL